MSKLKKTTLQIKGMHCPSCDILIQDKFAEVVNIKEVKTNYRNQKAEICYTGSLDRDLLQRKIAPYGYQVASPENGEAQDEPLMRKISDAAAIFIILFIAFFFAQEFNLLPSFNSSSGLTLGAVFVLGLVASTSTCMATSGALFLATVGKLTGPAGSFPPASARSNVPLRAVGSPSSSVTRQFSFQNIISFQSIFPAISFNLGRVLSYGFFGLVFGFLGKSIALNLQLSSFLWLFVAFFMVMIGLDMLKLLPFSSFISSSLIGALFRKIESRLIKNPKKTAFLLGASTYLLPCGFTQMVQFYALGLADPLKSMLTMIVFALGTTPALLAIAGVTSFTRSSFYPFFSKVIAVLLVMFGIYYFSNFLTVYGLQLDVLAKLTGAAVGQSNVVLKDGYQVVTMNVNARGYSPSYFRVKKGVPVKWLINGDNVFGCQGLLVSRQLGVIKTLGLGQNVITFTPDKTGPILFSCAMGMYRGWFDVAES